MRRRPGLAFRPRRRRRPLVIILLVLLALLVIGAAAVVGGGYWYLSRSAPPRQGTLHLAGLQSEVRVYWDERGIPHIEAANLHDLFFAQGYITAQDRLWQMDLFRRVAAGRLAEVAGETALDQDRFFRTLGLAQAAAASLELAEPETLAMVQAYAAGVTAYIRQIRESGLLPIEFRLLGYTPEPWTPTDTLLVARLMAYYLSYNWATELSRYIAGERLGWDVLHEYLPDYPADAPAIVQWPSAPRPPAGPPPDATPAGNPAAHPGGPPGTAPGEAPATGPAGRPGGVPAPGGARDGEGALDPGGAPDTGGAAGTDGAPYPGAAARRRASLASLLRFALPPHLGSNSWALAGSRTATGGALLANDPHMQYTAPALWHQVHLVLEGDLNVIGITVPGVPGVVFGRNEHIAWAITSLEADSQDLFIQRPNPDNPREFLYQGAYEPARVRREIIHVAGRSDPVVMEVLETRHGPVLNPLLDEEPADVLSLAWTALGGTRELNALLPLMRARNFAEFERAVDLFDMPALSFLYADAAGNIGYKASGLLPVRPAGDGRVPRPAWTGEHDWRGTIPKSELPRSYNPPEGFIITANNLPASPPYPHYIGDGHFPWRAQRLRQVLAQATGATVADMQALQLDLTNTHAQRMLPQLLAALETAIRVTGGLETLSSAEREALSLLQEWDFVEHPEAAAPLVWHLWQRELRHTIVDRGLGVPLQGMGLVDHLFSRMPPSEQQRVALAAFRDAVGAGVALQGTEPSRWQWGRWHRLTAYHAVGESVPLLGLLFNVGDWPVGGSDATPQAMGFHETSGRVAFGAAWRTVVDLASGRGWDILLPGNSGHVLSPHYRDQAEPWRAGQLMEQQWRPDQYRRSPLLRLLPP
ncbi:MAG: penicillin acylase family protein [Limnochordales bacterium]